MKTYTILLFFTVFVLNCYSQELKKVHTKSMNGLIEETYYVLKSDKKIKHGAYELIYLGTLVQKGDYSNGKKIGNWYYYKEDGSKEFVYNYDSLKIISDSMGVARPALYSEGMAGFQNCIYTNLKYPQEALREGKSGRVYVSFSVDSNGIPGDFKIEFGLNSPSLDSEAIRVVKKACVDHEWYPAINEKGEKVKSRFKWPVNFSLGM